MRLQIVRESPDRYDAAWNELRRQKRFLRRVLLALALLIAGAATLSAIAPARNWLSMILGPILIAAIIGLAFVSIVSYFRITYWRCPRCGNFFFFRGWMHHRGTHCLWCRLSLYEPEQTKTLVLEDCQEHGKRRTQFDAAASGE